MSYNREDYIRIKAEFSQKYKLDAQRAREHQAELYGAIPEVWEIDRILAGTGMEIMGAVSRGESAEETIALLRARNDSLMTKRGRLLQKHGYPADYSDIHYECPICGDTGFTETKMCECMRRALVLAGYESSGIGGLIQSQSFDNFSLEYYKNFGGNYESVKMALGYLRSFAESFDQNTYHNFLLVGGTGLGKTHLSTSVARTVIDRGYDVLYVTATEMLADFECRRFGNGAEPKRSIERYGQAELLIVDDLGTEVTNQFTLSCIYDVMNERINRRRSTMISTNLAYKDLEGRYGERIASRLFGEYHTLMFRGKDIRQQKILQE